jgi:hypothetical protein
VLLTDSLARQLEDKVNVNALNVHVLPVKGDPKSLLQLSQPEVDQLRSEMLTPWKTTFNAPAKVGFYLFRDGSWVIENFADEPANVSLNHQPRTIERRSWIYSWN